MLFIGILLGIFLVFIVSKLFKDKCEHKWELIKESKKEFVYTRYGEQVGNVRTVILKAFKCSDCMKFKFWYSYDMNDYTYLSKAKELFEFNVINGLEEK